MSDGAVKTTSIQGTKYPDLFAALAAPFEISEVKIRHQANRAFHYITARTAMNRLDAVLGPENWWDEYFPSEHSVLCRLTICLPDGEVLTKQDAGGYAGMNDQGDDDKSGFSDAFKRACVKFGIARYLYRDGVPQFVRDYQPKANYGLPDGAEGGAVAPRNKPPQETRDQPQRKYNGNTQTSSNPRDESIDGSFRDDTRPKHGRALFAWTKKQEERYEIKLLKYLNDWAKLQEFPGRMVDWDPQQVAAAYAEACHKLGKEFGEPNHDQEHREAFDQANTYRDEPMEGPPDSELIEDPEDIPF